MFRKIILFILVFGSLNSCSLFEYDDEPSSGEVTEVKVEETAKPAASLPAEEKTKIEEKHDTHHKEQSHHKPPEGVEPQKALGWLKNGNRRFVKNFFRNDGAKLSDVERLSTGQKPHSIILSCSDSRVPPEVIFDQKLGEVFVIRTAGEAIDSMVLASIEYAIEHLGSRNLVVLGHTQCGAVKAALATLEGADAGSVHLNKLVKDIHPRIGHFYKKPTSKNYADEGWANVDGVVKDLVSRSSIIASAVKSGHLMINSALYHIEHGQVEFK